MRKKLTFEAARDLLLSLAAPVGTERLPLEDCGGRVLAADLLAGEDVPAFDRSPYDGYALRAADSAGASREAPVTLSLTEEIAAGAVPARPVGPGQAAKVLTGAPIPAGADAVVMYEKTAFTADAVTLFAPLAPGENIVRTGEDVRAGSLLVRAGTAIDAGLAGALAAQGVLHPEVYRRPLAGLISTGSELVDGDGPVPPGSIRNTNRYTLSAALGRDGCAPRWLGTAGDRAAGIAALITAGLADCDLIVLTGGVSAGDYDLTPAAMELAGVELLAQGVDIKPGMACAYGVKDGKPVYALSGNPASSLTNYCAVVRPAVRRLAGLRQPLPAECTLTLLDDFPKKSKCTRLLRGALDLSSGTAGLRLSPDQGNAVLSSAIGCDAMAVVPAGSGPLAAGTVLKGFTL